MKRNFRIYTGMVMIIGFLFITTDSCKKVPVGHCAINCNTGITVTGDDMTQAECENETKTNAAACSCNCSYDWTPN